MKTFIWVTSGEPVTTMNKFALLDTKYRQERAKAFSSKELRLDHSSTTKPRGTIRYDTIRDAF